MPDFKFNVGDEAKDKITGFKGIVISRSQWLNSCNTYGLQSKTLHDGAPIRKEYFDEPQLEMVAEKVHEQKADTGGPTESIPQTNRM